MTAPEHDKSLLRHIRSNYGRITAFMWTNVVLSFTFLRRLRLIRELFLKMHRLFHTGQTLQNVGPLLHFQLTRFVTVAIRAFPVVHLSLLINWTFLHPIDIVESCGDACAVGVLVVLSIKLTFLNGVDWCVGLRNVLGIMLIHNIHL